MRELLDMIIGVIGGIFITIFGGFDVVFQALVVFLIIDYITGIMVAGIFRKSKKSNSGALSSQAGWKGIAKKIATLLMVAVANYLDKAAGLNYIKGAVCIGLLTNEGISILENYTLMGGSGAEALQKALDVLKSKKSE